jgi:hypothetical protein
MKKFLLPTLFFAAALTAQAQTARVQVIHTCADPAADTVDVWLDNTLLIDNFAFRTASAFVDATAGTPITIGIAPKNSTSSADALDQTVTTLTSGETYIVAATGVLGTGFSPATPFALAVKSGAREIATINNNTDILVLHAATDAPTVDIRSQDLSTILVDSLVYGAYSSYLEIPTNNIVIAITDNSGGLIARYSASLATLSLTLGQTELALTVVASGFVNPATNSNGETFGLWVATAAGGNLVELPLFVEGSISSIAQADYQLRTYPVPAQNTLNVAFELSQSSQKTLLVVSDITGRVLQQTSLNDLNAGSHNQELDLNQLSNGLYYLNIYTTEGKQTQAFSVAK